MAKIMKNLQVGLQIVVSIAILYIVFTQLTTINDLITVMQRAHIGWMLFVILLGVCVRYMYSFQTAECLQLYNIQISVHTIFRARMLAQFYGLLLPGIIASGGITWYELSKSSSHKIQLASVIFFVRFFNIAVLFPLAIFAFWIDMPEGLEYLQPAVVISGIGITLLILPFFWKKAGTWYQKVTQSILGVIKVKKIEIYHAKIWGIVNSFNGNSRFYWVMAVESLFRVFISVLGIRFTGDIVHVCIPWGACFLIPVVLELILSLPISFMGIGVRDVSLIFLLQFYGITATEGLSISVVTFIMGLIISLLGGIFLLPMFSPPDKTNNS